MKTFLEQIARSQQPLGTTLVVGAGSGSDLPALRELPAARLVLAEAHARSVEELAARIMPDRGEEVWPLAIVPVPTQQSTLHILNNPRFNSLNPPTGLSPYYPNLRVIGQAEVATRTLAEAIDRLALDTTRPHVLVLDAPGQAGDLLSATAVQALQAFTWIILRCAAVPLYADDKQAQDLLEQLDKGGFDFVEEDPQSLYPQVSFLLTRNELQVEKLRLQSLTQRLIEKRDEQTRLAMAHKAELDKAAQVLTEQRKLAADWQAQVQTLIQERDKQATLARERQELLDKVSRQNQERGARIIELEREQARVDRHQVWLDQEVAKTEAQVELIKEVLLREKTL